MIDPFNIPHKIQGDRVTLPCAISNGDPPINITWTKDDAEIPPDVGIVVEVNFSSSTGQK